MVRLSFIVPVYNEHARLIRGIEAIHKHLNAQPYSWEFILVDDGSDIPVTNVINKKKYRVSIVRLPKNQGKGAAIAAGVNRAKGRYVVFSDIDLSVPLQSLKPLLSQLNAYDIVIGSRRSQGAKIIVHQKRARELLGRIFTWLSDAVCRAGVSDATCGFKGFRAGVARRLFATSKIHRWVFDTELLFLARKYRYSILELPVSWSNREGSKVKIGDMVVSFIDLLKIRVYDAGGMYK